MMCALADVVTMTMTLAGMVVLKMMVKMRMSMRMVPMTSWWDTDVDDVDEMACHVKFCTASYIYYTCCTHMHSMQCFFTRDTSASTSL